MVAFGFLGDRNDRIWNRMIVLLKNECSSGEHHGWWLRATTQTLLAVKKYSNFMRSPVAGMQKSGHYPLSPLLALLLASATSHLVKLLLPNIYV